MVNDLDIRKHIIEHQILRWNMYGDFVPYTNAISNVNLGNFDLTATDLNATNFSVGATIGTPTNASGTIITGGTGGYTAPGGASVTIYAYKTIGATTIYSAGAGATQGQGPGNPNFDIRWDWDAVTGAEGYLIVKTGIPEYYVTVSTNTYLDENSWSLTPPPSVATTVLGVHSILGSALTLNCPITGNLNLTGAIVASSTIKGTSLTGSGLTTGRMVYTTTSGLLTSSANALYNGTTLTLTASTGTALKTVSGALWLDGTSGNTPTSGAGTRLMYIPAKGGAFRCGVVTSTKWDNANIGTGSVAFGNNTVSGTDSLSFGSGNTVSGVDSVCFGLSNTITGDYSMAWGSACSATGTASTAGGYGATCTSFGGLALGINIGTTFRAGTSTPDVANGSFCLGMCDSGTMEASGSASFAFGYNVSATANTCFAFGYNFTNSTANSFRVGFSATPTLNVIEGKIGINTVTPSARLHLPAGTSTAGTAPIKFTSGNVTTNAVVGEMQFYDDDYYLTITTGPTLMKVVLTGGLITGRLPYTTTNGRLTSSSTLLCDGTNITISAGNLITDTSTGMKIGTSTSQKLAFYNSTPVVQPTAVADATDVDDVITQLNSLLAKMRTLGLIAT